MARWDYPQPASPGRWPRLGWLLLLARFAPFTAMLDNPIGESLLEPDVPPGFFGFDPFMAKDFLALDLEFAVERRILKEIRGVVGCHSQWYVTGA
jgi:hypothetical protein